MYFGESEEGTGSLEVKGKLQAEGAPRLPAPVLEGGAAASRRES